MLFQGDWRWLWNARAEQIEAVTKTAGKDPRIEIGVADNVQAAKGSVVAPGHRSVEPRLLHVGIEVPAIAERDVISDDGKEIYNILMEKGIKNVFLAGVHTNKCVLARPFGIRQMVMLGMNVLLVRDLTDSLYNPSMRPWVAHERGTQLVVEHIEKYWCPSISGQDLKSP